MSVLELISIALFLSAIYYIIVVTFPENYKKGSAKKKINLLLIVSTAIYVVVAVLLLHLNQHIEMISDVDADLVFCGHTHQPCGYQTNTKQTVVNVGSVGRPLSEIPKACYAVLTIDKKNEEFSVEHRLVTYDKELASKILANRGFEGSDKLAGMLISASERYPA